MKKIGVIVGLLLVLVVGLAILQAGKMGETSHAFAKGKVVLATELEEQAKDIETLFIVASGLDQPMPLGAFRRRVSAPRGVVYEFVLTNESMQRMQMEQPFPEEFKLKARLDRDGLAGPDQSGDLVGEVLSVRLGAADVEITIDRVVP